MSVLFVALGIMVLALLALLLWFVPVLLAFSPDRVSNRDRQRCCSGINRVYPR